MSSQTTKQLFVMTMILLLSASAVNCQSMFTGRITYEISYPGSAIDYATRQQLPDEIEIVANDELVRTEMEAGELHQVKITNSEDKSVTTILEILREEYVIRKSHDEVKESIRELPEPKITYTDETKEILGYECKKAEAVVYDQFGDEQVIEIYYTEEIKGEPFNFDLPYNEIPGLMLEYEVRAGNLNMRYEATEIKSRWGIFISSRNFRVPSDAAEITFEELQDKLQ